MEQHYSSSKHGVSIQPPFKKIIPDILVRSGTLEKNLLPLLCQTSIIAYSILNLAPYPQRSVAIAPHQRSHFSQKMATRAGEMAQWLRALTALPEVLSLIPSNHVVAHNHI